MNSLTTKHCVPCEGGVPALTPDESEKFMEQIPGWELNETSTEISRKWKFEDFSKAMIFVNAVAALSEAEDHHPDFTINYSRVTLKLSTHAIEGLSENDFIMAAKINELLKS